MLHEFISANRAELVTRCRAKVAVRVDPPPTPAEIDHGVPMFLGQLLDQLRDGPATDMKIAETAAQHGHDLLLQGYTVSQVVHDYGDVCQAVTELAVERRVAISSGDFQTLNRCLDNAIAGAVTEFGRPDADQSKHNDGADSAQHVTVMRDLLKTLQISKVAFEAIRSGRVGIAGSTAAVLTLGLDTALDLAQRRLAEAK